MRSTQTTLRYAKEIQFQGKKLDVNGGSERDLATVWQVPSIPGHRFLVFDVCFPLRTFASFAFHAVGS